MHQSILTYGEFVTYIRENVEAVLNEDRGSGSCFNGG